MLTLCSPAKINLFLRIIRRREDGYHELATLLQAISLTDTLKIALSDKDHLFCTDPTIPTDHHNLVIKAADLFRRKTGLRFGIHAELEKRIPHQAGLGGGSGNAATTLWGINQLCGQPASDADLALWAGEIGSDISFFLSNGTAYCTSRGENLRAIDPIPQQKLWIVKPKQGLSTPEVFRNLNVTTLVDRDPEKYLHNMISGDYEYFNDLEATALKVMPSLLDFKNKLLDSGFKNVVMTGTGSAFFCVGDSIPRNMPEAFCEQVRFLNRKLGSWYSLKG